METNYYELVRNTMMNPGLKLIPENDLEVIENDGNVMIRVEEAVVQFFNEDEKYSKEHFARRGYPSQETISFQIMLTKEKDRWRIENYDVITSNS